MYKDAKIERVWINWVMNNIGTYNTIRLASNMKPWGMGILNYPQIRLNKILTWDQYVDVIMDWLKKVVQIYWGDTFGLFIGVLWVVMLPQFFFIAFVFYTWFLKEKGWYQIF